MKMTAREMFERLGYRCIKSNNSIWYINDSDEENYRSVEFYFCDCTFDAIGNYGDPLMVNVKELEAINKQCEEIGWLEEEKQEIKQETNFEHYKDRILDCCIDNLAVVKGIPKSCSKIDCNDCDFLTIQKDCREIAKDWLKQPHKKLTYKLNKFEIDLLQSCSQGYSPKYQFKNINSLTEMRKNGYFKCINRDETIEEILAKCEVMD